MIPLLLCLCVNFLLYRLLGFQAMPLAVLTDLCILMGCSLMEASDDD